MSKHTPGPWEQRGKRVYATGSVDTFSGPVIGANAYCEETTQTDFEALLACYRSGQVSERQWQGHLKDRAFRAWVENQNPINCPSACSGGDNHGQEGEGAAANQLPEVGKAEGGDNDHD